MLKRKGALVRVGLVVVIVLILFLPSCSGSIDNSVSHEQPSAVTSTPVDNPVAILVSPTVSQSTPAESPTATAADSTNISPSSTDIDITSYRLVINGLIDTPLSLTYQSIMAYPTITKSQSLYCEDVFQESGTWTGVPVATLLNEAGLKPEASQVIFHAVDGYQIQLSIAYILENNLFLAYTMDGQTLPWYEGYPLRLIVTPLDGSTWVKWVTRMEIK